MTNEQLKAWRSRLSLGEAGMAAYLGTPVTTYRKWENGTRQPDSSTRRLFDVLQLVETSGDGDDPLDSGLRSLHDRLIAAAVTMGGPEKVRKPRKTKVDASPAVKRAIAMAQATDEALQGSVVTAPALPAWMMAGSNPPR